jgi:hypothetical protein
LYSVILIFDFFGVATSDRMPNAFTADIGAVQNVVSQQRPFGQTTDAFNPTGRQTEFESRNYIYS